LTLVWIRFIIATKKGEEAVSKQYYTVEDMAKELEVSVDTTLFYMGVEYLGQAKALERHGTDIVVSDITELGGQR
jgi:hypothetical protein